jgi:hypothetical protein
MEKFQKTLFLGLLMLFVVCVYYLNKNSNKTSNKTKEHFEEKHIPQCHDPQFEIKGMGNEVEYCAKIDNIGQGCQKFDKGLNRNPLLAAFSIFGSYIDNLDTKDVTPCVNDQAKTLSEWGLCEPTFLGEVKKFGYKENEPIISAIENACMFYKDEFTKNHNKLIN